VSHHRNDELDRALQSSRVPNVFVGRPLSADDRGVQYVDTDNVEGGRIATQHLIERGRRRIGTIAGPQDMSGGIDRLSGWRSAMAAAGMADDAVAYGDFTLASGAAAAREILERFPDLDALFIASDLMAAGALGVLAELNKDVPGDIAVVGYDNLGVAASTVPPLTSVIQPVVAMARAAGARLLAQLNGAPPSEPLIFAPELVVRAST
jgi:DNA-binding LacI/PurR family transcriptional regulator